MAGKHQQKLIDTATSIFSILTSGNNRQRELLGVAAAKNRCIKIQKGEFFLWIKY